MEGRQGGKQGPEKGGLEDKGGLTLGQASGRAEQAQQVLSKSEHRETPEALLSW